MSETGKDLDLIMKILTAAKYEKMSLADMKQAPYNPRKDLRPEDEEYQQIRASIVNHGLLQPIVYNKRTGHDVGGNQRRKILMDGGVTEVTAAVIDVSLQREKEINIALNRIGNMWDQPKLRDIFAQLKEEGYDLTRTSFPENEIEELSKAMQAEVISFFEDQDEDEDTKEKPVRQYKCPYCGEVFEK